MPDETPILFDFPSLPNAADQEKPPVELELPVLPILNTVIFPHMLAPLLVNRARGMAAIEAAMTGDKKILVVSQRDADGDDGALTDMYSIGVEATIQRVIKMPDGSINVVIQGQQRVRLGEQVQNEPCLRARATPLYTDEERTLAVEALMRAVLSIFEKVVKLSRTLPDDSYIMAMNIDEPGWLADLIASILPLDVARRQEVLETLDPEERLRRISTMLSHELDLLELESRIHNQVQKEVDRTQRETFLREQIKAIQRELGEDDPFTLEMMDLRSRIEIAGMPQEVYDKAMEELDRLEVMQPAAPEYNALRTYVDWLVELPWSARSEDNNDLYDAADILDANHYGLPKVKERILEFMAVRQLAGPRMKTPIICFVGPPGVGKTSLGRSIAEALERKFVRLSLGGVHDEAEIRGHRRTYLGALPGRIIKTMKEAGTTNPVFMLDEIDKLGRDFKGDPAAALLEVLDPEQNSEFADHYLDVPYDLSDVMFITTANLLDPIPEALLDRMEIIEIPGYIEEEKVEIARQFLITKQWEANGLPPGILNFTDDALRTLIRSYTYEAGVRNLEREIGAICRKTARRIAEGRRFQRRVVPRLLHEYLGPPRYSQNIAEERDEIGVATGLAYTANGGDAMAVEVTLMEGKGNLMLTGQLGEVMQESAQAALSYARANAKKFGIDAKRFERIDIHVHVPEGGVPKDGPSAGVTLATALISALTGRAVRRDVAMTGEITLRGRVLPVGGIRDKVLGGYRAGISTIILPNKNERDLIDVPSRVKRKLRFVHVQHMDEILTEALLPLPQTAEKKKPKARSERDDVRKAQDHESISIRAT